MLLDVFLDIAKKRGLEIGDLAKGGQCELLFDDRHLITIEADAGSLLFRSNIVPLSMESVARQEQLSLTLKTSLALMTSTLSAPFIVRSSAVVSDEEVSGDEKGEPSSTDVMQLVRLLDGSSLPGYEVENELESFLAALEVYKSKLTPVENNRKRY